MALPRGAVAVVAIAAATITCALEGCSGLMQSGIDLACRTKLEDVLNDIEKAAEDKLAEFCNETKHKLIDSGLDTTDVKDTPCFQEGQVNLTDQTKAEIDEYAQQCIDKLNNASNLTALAQSVKDFIKESTPDIDLQGKLDQTLSDLRDEAKKQIDKVGNATDAIKDGIKDGIDDAKDSVNDGLDSVSDSLGDDDDDESTGSSSGSSSEEPARLFDAHTSHHLGFPGSGSFAMAGMMGAAVVALAGLLALARRSASRQIGGQEQHEVLVAEDSESGQ